jgi:gluconokinase
VQRALTIFVHFIAEAFAASGLKQAARFSISFQPELFAAAQVGHQRQRQARLADAVAAKHAPGRARPHAGQQFAAIQGEIVFGGGHCVTIAQCWRTGRDNWTMPPVSHSSAHVADHAAIHVVVMGVAGCGKSAVGRLIAQQLALPLVEGDDFHSPGNIKKMQQGVALMDEDRADWLRTLGDELARHPDGVVLTCSALKKAYRDRLRQAAPRLCFVHLAISPAEALRRVGQRPGHFYPPSLVASQFAALQDPSSEAGVLTLDGAAPLQQLALSAVAWLKAAGA